VVGVDGARVQYSFDPDDGMRTVRLGKHQVSLYTSIDELPMERFHRYNKMLLIDAGIGSDITAFDAHIEKVVRYIQNGDRENAAKEMENMRQNVYVIQTEQSPANLSFAVLVKEIDGKACNDISDEGLERVRAMLSDVTRKEMTTEFSEVKKKIEGELMEYFPSLFSNVEEREYYDNMKRLAVEKLGQITNGESERSRKHIAELEDRLVLAVKPKVFTGKDAFGVQHDKSYVKMCLMISTNLNVDARSMTVLEYYTAGEYLNEMMKERKKALPKRR
jgi:hypothetical protein